MNKAMRCKKMESERPENMNNIKLLTTNSVVKPRKTPTPVMFTPF